MIESNKIYEILQGSNIYSTFYINGWCKTSSGVSFGKERIKELLDYIELEKNDTGLKDINGKSIYADSSIVEFTNNNNKKQYQGYFKYDLYHQRMFFWFLCCVRDNKSFGYLGEGLDRVEYLPCAMTNFKIIDTIQENKLGLIK